MAASTPSTDPSHSTTSAGKSILSMLKTPQSQFERNTTAHAASELEAIATRSKKLLGAPGIATRSDRTLLGAPGIATRSDRTLLGAPGRTTRSNDAISLLFLLANIATTSKALVTTSDALVTTGNKTQQRSIIGLLQGSGRQRCSAWCSWWLWPTGPGPGEANSSDLRCEKLLVASLLLVVRPGAPNSVRSLLVAMPGAPSSFLFM